MKNDKTKKILGKISLIVLIALIGYAIGVIATMNLKIIPYNNLKVSTIDMIKLNTTVSEPPCKDTDSTSQVYVICDVEAMVAYGDTTGLYCKMPNGDLVIYEVTDCFTDVREVCLATDNQDDYTRYRVVGLR